MPRRVSIEPHLSIDELENRYRQSKDAIANQSFDSLDELESVLFQRCQVLSHERELIRGLTCYHWWPLTDDSCTACI